MMSLKTISTMAAVGLISCGAAAEPIVVLNDANDPTPNRFNLMEADPSYPNLSFNLDLATMSGGSTYWDWRPVIIENGTECFGNFPGNLFPEVADIGYFNASAGMIVDTATGSWVYTEPLCDVGSVLGVVKRSQPGDFDCQPGCSFENSNYSDDGVLYIPFRWHLDGETDWFYGWSAFEITEEFVGDCEFVCKPGIFDPMFAVNYKWLAVGYETEADTGIIIGGGLCPADINFDAELDFFDVSAYLSLFSSGDVSADLNGDGSLDFFDISEFLGYFNDDCGL